MTTENQAPTPPSPAMTQAIVAARLRFFEAVEKHLGKDVETVTRKQIKHICREEGISFPAWFTHNLDYRITIGTYSVKLAREATPKTVPSIFDIRGKAVAEKSETSVNMLTAVVSDFPDRQISYIPESAQGYVPFGNHSDVRSIIRSREFYPIYITGLSGNGKTMMVEQASAQEKRECVRVNITVETDEDDLIGGFRLQEGRTVWHDGPVITAMVRGATLLLDEVDLGSNKLMCLQPVLEGRPIYIKKIGKVIEPAHGFNVIATANTKGKGSDDGRFIGTNIMNEAFLERFSITFEQEYPNATSESKILNNVLAQAGRTNEEFVEKLVKWAGVIRKSFEEGAISEIISTRRLVHIIKAFVIFDKEDKAMKLCLNRFDVDTAKSFIETYEKLQEPKVTETEVKAQMGDEIPF